MQRHITLREEEGGNGGSNGGGTLLSGGGASQSTASQTQTTQHQGDDGSQTPTFDFRSALGEDGSFKQGWDANLPADLKEYAANLTKYPNPVELLRGHANAVKLIGQRQQIKPPGPEAKPEELAAWRKTLGVPEKPEDYGLKKPEKLPEGVEWNDQEAAEFTKFAHEANLTPAQVQALVAYDIKQRASMIERGKSSMDAYIEKGRTELTAEWGQNFDVNREKAEKAAALLGIDPNDPEIGNSPKLIKALYNASKLFAEDKLVGSDKLGSGMTSPQQAEDIRRNPNNPWHKAYLGQEGKERQMEAANLIARLSGVKIPS